MLARPSLLLSATLPTKPSQTTRSTTPLKMSLPSTLPLKLRSPLAAAARNKTPACLMTSLPLIASSPMLSRPTVGDSLPLIATTRAEPMTANCNRCSALQSTLAPRSSMVVAPPVTLGIWPAIAGRSMPSSVLSTKRAIAISAPVLPAETAAWAAPSLTWLIATRIDESRLRRSATSSGSSIVTTSLAAMTWMRVWSIEAGSLARASGRPTSSRWASG